MKDKSDYDDKEKRDYQKEVITKTLEALRKQGFIECTMDDDTICASIVPQKEEYIEIEDGLLDIEDFRRKGFSQSVDWVSALKVLFAQLYLNKTSEEDYYKNDEVEYLTGIGSKQIGRVNRVLREDFDGVVYDLYRYKTGKEIPHNLGHAIEIGIFGITRTEGRNNVPYSKITIY